MEKIPAYKFKTSDGLIFDDEEAVIDHEYELKLQKNICDFLEDNNIFHENISKDELVRNITNNTYILFYILNAYYDKRL